MTNVTLPKLSDLINISSGVFEWSRIFTYAWFEVFGLWTIAMFVGVIGGALYMKYENTAVPMIWFIVMGIFLGRVIEGGVLYIFGIISMFILGFLLYKVFIEKS